MANLQWSLPLQDPHLFQKWRVEKNLKKQNKTKTRSERRRQTSERIYRTMAKTSVLGTMNKTDPQNT